MHTISIAGLHITVERKEEILAELRRRLQYKERTVVVTPYSEFLFAALKDSHIRDMLNKADIAIPDGIGIVWAAHYLNLPLRIHSKPLRWIFAAWQMVYSGASILIRKSAVYDVIPEKISGSDFLWDLGRLAESEGKSVFLLGGYGDTPHRVGSELLAQYPRLKLAGTSNADYPGDAALVERINASGADMLFVAWGPIRQERWILENWPVLSGVKLAIGLGGAFDYAIGMRVPPPTFIRNIGLEWLYRLITQPRRWKRMFNATFGLVSLVMKYKIKNKM